MLGSSSRLHFLEELAGSSASSPEHPVEQSQDDPALAEARAMLAMDEEEYRRLQKELAVMRNECRGHNRYREVMEQTLNKLRAEVAGLRHDLAKEERMPTPHEREAAATERAEQQRRDVEAWRERQEAARAARRAASGLGPAAPDLSRPRSAGARPHERGHVPGPMEDASSSSCCSAAPREALRAENGLLRKRIELLLPGVQACRG